MSALKHHIFAHAVAAWGHTKPLVAFCVLVLESRSDTVVTIATNESMYPKALAELYKLPKERLYRIQERMNILDVVGHTMMLLPSFPQVDSAFEVFYKQSGTVKCQTSGRIIHATDLPRPTVAIIDIVPVPKGELLQLPGYPKMYDYEFFPQPSDMPHGIFWRDGQIALYMTQGIINVATSAVEKEAIDTLRGYYKSIGIDYLNVAPLAILSEPSTPQDETSESDKQVISFLDNMEARFGPKSVIYISFGTLNWPDLPSLTAAVEELVTAQVPMLLAHPAAVLSEEMKRLVSESGLGMEVQWAPQQRVLAHSATGWFITHGGWNSVQEACLNRVPPVIWPISAEQPFNAALLSVKFKAAFELVEVRRGIMGTRKPYRCGDGDTPAFTIASVRNEIRGLIAKMRNDEGRMVRANFESLCAELAKAWDDGGEAKQEMDRFLNTYLI
ncbi:hypothetical protein VNI00_014066 [Paramarasmius palmivorus]|uniref:Glycosyltransferase family 1 protein n=1 Tax=Paramarasmius palmivorus TaxID=297713 RepID=A0AAW0BYS5_9AGAR